MNTEQKEKLASLLATDFVKSENIMELVRHLGVTVTPNDHRTLGNVTVQPAMVPGATGDISSIATIVRQRDGMAGLILTGWADRDARKSFHLIIWDDDSTRYCEYDI
jgi:hypothetical protein